MRCFSPSSDVTRSAQLAILSVTCSSKVGRPGREKKVGGRMIFYVGFLRHDARMAARRLDDAPVFARYPAAPA